MTDNRKRMLGVYSSALTGLPLAVPVTLGNAVSEAHDIMNFMGTS